MKLHRAPWIVLSLAFLSSAGGCATREQADVPLVREVAERTVWRSESRSGDQSSTTRGEGLRVKDPYLWVYNANFAHDFGMPGRWIDNTLSGADALAFRTMESLPMCGWGGKRDACRISSICILEMYFHHDRNPLPWNDALRWTEFWSRNTSADTLYALRSFDRAESQAWMRPPFLEPGTKKDLEWWYVHISKRAWGGGTTIVSYDRSIFGSYSLVVLNYGCMHPELAGLDLASQPFSSSHTKAYRSIAFPLQWRSRVKSAIQKVNEEDSRFFRDQRKQLELPRPEASHSPKGK